MIISFYLPFGIIALLVATLAVYGWRLYSAAQISRLCAEIYQPHHELFVGGMIPHGLGQQRVGVVGFA